MAHILWELTCIILIYLYRLQNELLTTILMYL